MAKLYFYYSSMNAGKSTNLLQSSYNYKERGMSTLVLAPRLDDRYGIGKVTSRIGIESEATSFSRDTDLLALVTEGHEKSPLHCVLIDEAQFLTRDQVFQLSEVTDKLNIPMRYPQTHRDMNSFSFPDNLQPSARHGRETRVQKQSTSRTQKDNRTPSRRPLAPSAMAVYKNLFSRTRVRMRSTSSGPLLPSS